MDVTIDYSLKFNDLIKLYSIAFTSDITLIILGHHSFSFPPHGGTTLTQVIPYLY